MGMNMANKVRLGIIGLGGMGSYHASYIRDGKIDGCELTCVCDIEHRRLDQFSDVKTFTDSDELIRSGEVEAVLIATPHYLHTSVGIAALRHGLHVLVEKPISVQKADCERLIAAHNNNKQVFAAMFNQRTDPHYKKIRQLIEEGELGKIIRVTWIITDWFRPEAYYSSSSWRATWNGEGGGVLLNQCPHQLDLLQWLFGMPVRVRAFCGFGIRHDIEVEDQVTAYLEYSDGSTGVFIASTGEAPGTNRLEIAAERGKVIMEDGNIVFIRNEVPATEFSKTTRESFGRPDVWHIEIPVSGCGGQHVEITQNFVDAILRGTPLIAPGEDGLMSVELANAMLYSTLTNDTVELPLNANAFERALNCLSRESTRQKTVTETASIDMNKSF